MTDPKEVADLVAELRSIAGTKPGEQSLWDCTLAAWAADTLETLSAELERVKGNKAINN